MKKRITTDTGSVYIITDKTWERVSKSQESGPIRTEGGSILNHYPLEIEVGHAVVVITDNLTKGKTRLLATSKVVTIEEIE